VSRSLPATGILQRQSTVRRWDRGFCRENPHPLAVWSRVGDVSGRRFRSHTKITPRLAITIPPQRYTATSQSGRCHNHIAMSLASIAALQRVNVQPAVELQQHTTSTTSLFSSTSSTSPSPSPLPLLPSDDTASQPDMPPPAYHMVVDPAMAIPNVNSPYDSEDEAEREGDCTPEITINAATQIRGTGNIVSIAQMDSARIATLVTTLLNEGSLPNVACPPQTPVSSPSTSRTELRTKACRKLNITVNCGATIIGDRNIVGPGLGDIARQMQIAQRNAVILAAQQKQRQQQQEQQNASQRVPPMAQHHTNLYQAQVPMATQVPSPPMSRCSSLNSDTLAGAKRKAEDDAGESLLLLKRRC
jgi:hypothetical protein